MALSCMFNPDNVTVIKSYKQLMAEATAKIQTLLMS